MDVEISWPWGTVTARFPTPQLAQQLACSLPCAATVGRWGDLLYFPLPLQVEADQEVHTIVESGTVCYWREAKCVVIGLGQTPISTDKECRLPAPMPLLGKMLPHFPALYSMETGQKLQLRIK